MSNNSLNKYLGTKIYEIIIYSKITIIKLRIHDNQYFSSYLYI